MKYGSVSLYTVYPVQALPVVRETVSGMSMDRETHRGVFGNNVVQCKNNVSLMSVDRGTHRGVFGYNVVHCNNNTKTHKTLVT